MIQVVLLVCGSVFIFFGLILSCILRTKHTCSWCGSTTNVGIYAYTGEKVCLACAECEGE